MDITITQARKLREQLNATQLIILAQDANGECVASHGLSPLDAKLAAAMANQLKASLGWPATLCRSAPLPRICENCGFFKGTNRDKIGDCYTEPTLVQRKPLDPACRHFQAKG